MSEQDRIKGTRDDRTLTVEGEGAEEINQGASDGIPIEGYTKPSKDPCGQYGHKATMDTENSGIGYRVCRFCSAWF